MRHRWGGLACLASAVILAAAAAGCASGGAAKLTGEGPTTTPTTAGYETSAASESPDPVRSPSEVARAVNLQASDFPYLREKKDEGPSDEDRKSEAEFEACVGETHLGSPLAEADSPNFGGELGGQVLEFSSSAEVFSSASDAAKVATVLRSHQVFACFTQLVEPALEHDEAGTDLELVSVKTVRIPSPAPAVRGSFGYRVRATVAEASESKQLTAYRPATTPDGRMTLTLYLDLLAFDSGRVQVSMTAVGFPRPVPADLERNLMMLLQERAEREGARLD
jgi:hypothetical protein